LSSRIAEHLRSRRKEIEQALLARVYGISDPAGIEDAGYLGGFRAAAAAAVDFAIATVTSRPGEEPPIPPILLRQARLAARNKVRLDVVLRRYAAGHAILVDFGIEEAEREPDLSPANLRALLSSSASAFDRLLLCVGDEYAREADRYTRNVQERTHLDRVERLLAGEVVAADPLEYPLDEWHIGLVVEGVEVRNLLRDLARQVDRRLLAVEPRTGIRWAWLGGRTRIEVDDVARAIRSWSTGAKVALGEPGFGVTGWRLSHQQALGVLSLAEGQPVALARYAEMGVLASIRKDRVLFDSLRKLYLEPLSDDKEGENVLEDTLRAYFAAECSISSAASALKVHRQTVTSRLRTVEERLGRPISECSLELNLALTLDC
jgi:hypothetical protein